MKNKNIKNTNIKRIKIFKKPEKIDMASLILLNKGCNNKFAK